VNESGASHKETRENTARRQPFALMNNQDTSLGPPSIVGRALLVSNDSIIAGQLADSMREFAIAADVCSDIMTAGKLINTRKFEGIVVDRALGEQAQALLERVRVSPSNGHSVTFTLVESKESRDWDVQPNFVIQKPLIDHLVSGTLRAALGLIIRDYRRYFRCPIVLPVVIQIGQAAQISCETMNISEGGLAVRTTVAFKPGGSVRVQFALPGGLGSFDVPAEICWSDNRGRAGLQFRSIASDRKLQLQSWLSSRIEQGLPEPAARLFQKSR
jgi:PilZ domain